MSCERTKLPWNAVTQISSEDTQRINEPLFAWQKIPVFFLLKKQTGNVFVFVSIWHESQCVRLKGVHFRLIKSISVVDVILVVAVCFKSFALWWMNECREKVWLWNDAEKCTSEWRGNCNLLTCIFADRTTNHSIKWSRREWMHMSMCEHRTVKHDKEISGVYMQNSSYASGPCGWCMYGMRTVNEVNRNWQQANSIETIHRWRWHWHRM